MEDYQNKSQKVTITNCDKEPIHFIEEAQEHGVILVIDTAQDKVIQVSENCTNLLGISSENIVGFQLKKSIPDEIAASIFSKIQKKEHLYPVDLTFNGKPFLLIPHLNEDNLLIIDIEPFAISINPILFQEELSKILKEIKDTDPLEEMCKQATSLIKDLYGYNRVMMYRFDENWNGEVIAETKNTELESWLGLHYPATDIPKPARDIFLKQGVRMISDVNYKPSPLFPSVERKINLSKSELRGVSPIHIEYLKNMGIGASLTSAIILEGKLWGLIACHHYTPKFINYHQRQSCNFLAQVFSNKLALKNSNLFSEKMSKSEEVRKKLVLQMDSVKNLEDALSKFNPKFTDLLSCHGGAIYYQKKLTLVGITPTEKQVKKIISKVLNHQKETIFSTKQLSNFYHKAENFSEQAAGVFSIKIESEENNYLMWFRPEESKTVNWGGNPEKNGIIKEGVEYLHPRKSFEKWTQKVSGIAKNWQIYDVEAASQLQDSITHILVKKQKDEIKWLNDNLTEVNKELETFSYSVSHDLRAPLRGIDGYARILINKYLGELDEYGQNALKTILNAAEEMDLLIEDMLNYSKLGQNKLNISTFSTKLMVENIINSQYKNKENQSLQITVAEDLPTITGDKRMITQVFGNLISNAVKYTSKEEKPIVEISSNQKNDKKIFTIKDNGVGFDPKFNEKIFEVFLRVAKNSNFKGTGIGLATVKKVIEKHGGEVWATSKLGEGAIFQFYINEN